MTPPLFRNPREFVNVCVSLVQSKDASTQGTTYESNPTFEVVLSKVESTVAFQGTSPSDGATHTSFQGLRMDIKASD